MNFLTLNSSDLAKMGIEFSTSAEADRFIDIIQEEFEVRVGEAVSKGKTYEQMVEFENCSHEEAVIWLNQNCPNYGEIIRSIERELEDELRRYHDQILGAHLP